MCSFHFPWKTLQLTVAWLLGPAHHWNYCSLDYQWVTFTKLILQDFVAPFNIVDHCFLPVHLLLLAYETHSLLVFLVPRHTFLLASFLYLPLSIGIFQSWAFFPHFLFLNSFPRWSHSTYCFKYYLHVGNSQIYVSGLDFLFKFQTHYPIACLILLLII